MKEGKKGSYVQGVRIFKSAEDQRGEVEAIVTGLNEDCLRPSLHTCFLLQPPFKEYLNTENN